MLGRASPVVPILVSRVWRTGRKVDIGVCNGEVVALTTDGVASGE